MKFKVPFLLPTKDLAKSISQELLVQAKYNEGDTVQGDIEYSMVLPDYLFDALADTEEQFSTKPDINNRNISGLFPERTISRKFQKTQTAKLISQLRDYVNSLTSLLNDKHSPENESKKKKLFIYFSHESRYSSNSDNSAYCGILTKQGFSYFTGYEIMTDKFSGINKQVKKQYITDLKYYPPLTPQQNEGNYTGKELRFAEPAGRICGINGAALSHH